MSLQVPFLKRLSIVVVIISSFGGVFYAQQAVMADPRDCSGLPPIDGRNLLTKYADAVSVVQDNATNWGDQHMPLQEPSEGSELDQMFLANDTGITGKLYIGLTGNLKRTDTLRNTLLVFIDKDAGATATVLNTAGFGPSSGPLAPEALIKMDGVTLDFDADYAICVWRRLDGVQYGVLYNLNIPTDTGTALTLGTHFAVDHSNLVGVNGDPSNDPLQQQINAQTATTGFEFAIPFTLLGITSSSSVNIQAIIANFSGYISNQSLPVLHPTVGNVGGGEGCIGIHDPNEPHIVDFSTGWPSNQYYTFALSPSGTAPGGSLDGIDIPADYNRPAAAIQNNYTCFDDAAPFSPWPTNGSEIDQIFVTNDFGKVYVGVTGNIPYYEGNNNTIIVFIQTGSGTGVNQLITEALPPESGSGALRGMAGLTLDTSFMPQWAIEYWRGTTGKHNTVFWDLNFGTPYAMEFSMDPARHTQDNGLLVFSADMGNVFGVNTYAGDDPIRQEGFAATADSGALFSIPLSVLGIEYEAEIKVAAAMVSGSGFVSNQWLPPLNPTNYTPQTGSATFNDAPLPMAIPDGGGTSAEDLRTGVTMAGIDRITDINVSVSITHPAMSELEVSLRYEGDGRIVKLWDNAAGTNLNATFSSEGEGGTVLPAESLLTFNGANPNGNWTLIVTDSATGQTGTLNSWGLAVTEYTGGNVGCLGNHTPTTPIDLSSTTFPGDQYFTTSLLATTPPSSVTAANIPAAFPSAALVTQNNYTCFSDAQPPSMQDPIPGSEMDQLFITNTADRIKVAITGNLERNGNAFVILFDTVTGGESPLTGNPNPPGSINGLNGMVLDNGFLPDYGLAVNEFYGGFRADLTNLNTNVDRWLGLQGFGSGSGLLSVPGANSGSELDQLFVQNDADNVYIGITGNVEGNGNNAFVVFLDTISGGTNPLATAGGNGWPAALAAMNGDILAPGFYPDYAIVLWRSGWEFQTAKLCDLNNITAAPVDIIWSFDMLANTFVGNNDNVLGVNSNVGDDTLDPPPPGGPTQQELNAATATTGIQFAIDRISIGDPLDNTQIHVAVVLVGYSAYWSNQGLPGFGGGVPNLEGNHPVNASAVQTVVPYTVSSTYSAPATWDGTGIPTAMASHLLATQDNYTQFGDQYVDPLYNNDNCVQVAFDNTNIGGVTGCTQAGNPCECLGGTVDDAANVATGIEVDLALADLGLTPQDVENGVTIRVLALLTSGDGYTSNQFLPGLGGEECDPGWAPNMANYPDPQYLSYPLVPANPCGADPADINGDNLVNMDDVTALVGVLMGTNSEECPLLKANVNGDSATDGRDIQAFVTAYLN